MSSPPRLCRTDLSDDEWALLEPLIPAPKPGGRPPTGSRRAILNGIFYLVRTGCPWRLVPWEFPPWKTVYHYVRTWRIDGTWKRGHTARREREQVRQGRDPQPSACIMDSQSVKTTGVGGIRGDDGAKRLSGRKRHLLVDTLGLVPRVKIHAANIQERTAVPQALIGAKDVFWRLTHIWLDQGYTGSGKTWIEEGLGWRVEIVQMLDHVVTQVIANRIFIPLRGVEQALDPLRSRLAQALCHPPAVLPVDSVEQSHEVTPCALSRIVGIDPRYGRGAHQALRATPRSPPVPPSSPRLCCTGGYQVQSLSVAVVLDHQRVRVGNRRLTGKVFTYVRCWFPVHQATAG